MKHITTKDFKIDEKTAVMLGNFDGIHLGHQSLLEQLKAQVLSGLTSVVFSFSPPTSVYYSKQSVKTIYSSAEKAYLFARENVDVFVEYPFDETFAQTTPLEFVENILAKQLNCKVVIVGNDYTFGKKRAGNAAVLTEICKQFNITVIVCPEIVEKVEGKSLRVSSTIIRKLIENNHFEDVTRLLTRPYFVMGDVISGKKLGRTIGFPTANILPETAKLLPENGVYLTETMYENKAYKSITNIGLNPTVNGSTSNVSKVVETYLIDFNKDIYGETLIVNFVSFIRRETKFDSLEHLKKQINSDMLGVQLL